MLITVSIGISLAILRSEALVDPAIDIVVFLVLQTACRACFPGVEI